MVLQAHREGVARHFAVTMFADPISCSSGENCANLGFYTVRSLGFGPEIVRAHALRE